MAVIVLLVVVLGFVAGSDKASRESIEQWTVGGRNFGGIVIWFLIGADVYTAYTFLGLTGYGYSLGVPAFFATPYVVLAYPIAYYFLPKIWAVAKQFHMTTLADYVRERFDSRFLSALVALAGIAFLIPYIDLQLTGIENVVRVTGEISPAGVLVISFLLVGLYTYFSGIRAPAWTSVAKDLLVWVVMLILVIYLPVKWFGGWGQFLHAAQVRHPDYMSLPGHGGNHGAFWFATAAFISAASLFMWPHSSTGSLSSRTGESLRRNAIFLPFYNILLFFVTGLGILALLVVPGQTNSNAALLYLIQKSMGGFGQGIAFATIMLASLVPASLMVIAASNLLIKNIVRDVFAPNIHPRNLTFLTRLSVFLMVILALAFGILFPSSIISLQLQGVSGIVQILPAVVFSLWWRTMHRIPVGVGFIGGIVTVFLAAPLHLPGYAGFWGLVVNVAIVLILSLFLRQRETTHNEVARFLFHRERA
ncbi:sodium:solute symporter [Alicyclobacillus cycloheptanicus]|nr:sodium:solute symporter [Alicyclobacillus cycloheptanicus]